VQRRLATSFWGAVASLLTGACTTAFVAPLEFLPDGATAVTATSDGIAALELRSGSRRWERTSAAPVFVFWYSPTGSYVVAQSAVTPTPHEGPHNRFVFGTRDGRTVGNIIEPHGYPENVRDTVVPKGNVLPEEPISDDGKWFVSTSSDTLKVYDTATSKIAFEESGAAYGAAFEPRSARFATMVKTGISKAMAVYARQGETWARVGAVPEVIRFRWTPAGVLVATPSGLSVWNGALGPVLFPMDFLDSEGDGGALVFLGADGTHVAVQNRKNELIVYSVPSGRVLLRLSDVGDVRDVEYEGTRARVLTYEQEEGVLTAFLTEYDLVAGQKQQRIELDVVARTQSRGFFSFGFGGGWSTYRGYRLGPHGTFVACLRKGSYQVTQVAWTR
jgi:hypothetical protein